MKLEKEAIQHIQQAVKTAKLLGIEDIRIEQGLIRAMHPDRTVLIIDNNDIELPFESLGIARIPQFLDRFNIVSETEGFAIDFSGTDEFVKSLVMKCKGTRIEFKCSNPSTIIAPKGLADTLQYSFDISDGSIDKIRKGVTAMKADDVTIVSKGDSVSFEINDVNNDTFTHGIESKAVNINGEDNTEFAFRYPAKLLISLLRNNVNHIEITGKGSIKLNVNGIDTFIIAKV